MPFVSSETGRRGQREEAGVGRSVVAAGLVGVAALTGAHVIASQTQPRSLAAGAFTEQQSQRGGVVYEKECASCHGSDLGGMEEAPALAGPGFLANWVSQSVGALTEQTRKSMPKDNVNTLTRQQYIDVVAYMLHSNGYPAGSTELPYTLDVLNQMKIEVP
jgi:mono/diheme cytochrome c family protein